MHQEISIARNELGKHTFIAAEYVTVNNEVTSRVSPFKWEDLCSPAAPRKIQKESAVSQRDTHLPA